MGVDILHGGELGAVAQLGALDEGERVHVLMDREPLDPHVGPGDVGLDLSAAVELGQDLAFVVDGDARRVLDRRHVEAQRVVDPRGERLGAGLRAELQLVLVLVVANDVESALGAPAALGLGEGADGLGDVDGLALDRFVEILPRDVVRLGPERRIVRFLLGHRLRSGGDLVFEELGGLRHRRLVGDRLHELRAVGFGHDIEMGERRLHVGRSRRQLQRPRDQAVGLGQGALLARSLVQPRLPQGPDVRLELRELVVIREVVSRGLEAAGAIARHQLGLLGQGRQLEPRHVEGRRIALDAALDVGVVRAGAGAVRIVGARPRQQRAQHRQAERPPPSRHVLPPQVGPALGLQPYGVPAVFHPSCDGQDVSQISNNAP